MPIATRLSRTPSSAEFAARAAPFSNPLKDTTDGLRGFEITDPDGHVFFLGRPREAPEDDFAEQFTKARGKVQADLKLGC